MISKKTNALIGELMIIKSNNAFSALRFSREADGKLSLDIDQKKYAISNKQYFECHGNACCIQINEQQGDKINFSLRGKEKLMLIFNNRS